MKRQVIFAGDVYGAECIHTLETGRQEYWRDVGETGTRSGLLYMRFTPSDKRERTVRSDNPCVKLLGRSNIVQPYSVQEGKRFIQAALGTGLNVTKRKVW